MTRRAVTLLAAALFLAATAGRFALPNPANGVGFLYLIPICLLAIEFGWRGGLAASAVAFGLFAAWAGVAGVEFSLLGYVSRLLTFSSVGWIVGLLVEERKRLAEENERWFTMANGLLCVAGTDGCFKRVNPAWSEALGYTEAELLDRPFIDLVHPDDIEKTTNAAKELATPGSQTGFENRYRAKDGSWRWLLWTSRSDGHRIYAVAKDITDRKLLEENRLDQARALARVDELTGVANRRGFEEELPRALARAMRSETPLCVAMLDLDGLKAINDSSGHQAGSAAIKQAAAAWASLLRETDVIARFGGDEFAVILPGSSLDAAAIVAERLRVAIESHRASVSIGVAQWDGDEAMDQLIERADEALYEAKRGGRDRVITASAF